MDKIAHVKSQLRLQQWADQIEACQQSNMSVTDWCNANGIATNTYYYRLKKVREHTLDNLQASSNEICAMQSEVSFKKLEVSSPISGMTPAVIIHLPQATVEVSEGISQSTVEAVLMALKSTC